MEISSTVAILLISICVSQISSSTIPAPSIKVGRKTEKFKLHITEKGTKIDEHIEIDEQQQTEYIHVPAHNGLPETDHIYDFKYNETVTRVRSEGACYIGHLPDDLPRPADLKYGLQMMANTPASQNIDVAEQKLFVTDEIDKSTLREEVRDFCDPYPVYRVAEYVPDSVSVVKEDGGRTGPGRVRRDWLKDRPMCKKDFFPSPNNCMPQDWVFHLKIRGSRCTYYLTCNLDKGSRLLTCSKYKHLFSNMICYEVRCP